MKIHTIAIDMKKKSKVLKENKKTLFFTIYLLKQYQLADHFINNP